MSSTITETSQSPYSRTPSSFTSPVDIRMFGATGDGLTDDSTAIQNAVLSGGSIYFSKGTYFISKNITLSSNTRLFGPGTILGPPKNDRQATIGFVVSGKIADTYPSPQLISAGQSNFQIPNNFKAGDFALLSNFPTDPTDKCVIQPWGDCSYSNVSASNLRHTRRMEPAEIASASSDEFSLKNPTLYDYKSLMQLHFQKIIPVENVEISDLTFKNILINGDLTRNIVLKNLTGYTTSVSFVRTLHASINFSNFDAEGTESAVGCGLSSRFLEFTGSYKNLSTEADNALVKVDQAADVVIDVEVSNTINHGFGVMLDTNYLENRTGYSDVPTINVNAKVVAKNCTMGFFSTAEAHTPVQNLTLDYTSLGNAPISINATNNVAAHVSSRADAVSLNALGTSNLTITGEIGSLYMGTQTNAVTGETVRNSNFTFKDITFRKTDSTAHTSFNLVDGLTLQNFVVDVSGNLLSIGEQTRVDASFYFGDVSNLKIVQGSIRYRPNDSGKITFWEFGGLKERALLDTSTQTFFSFGGAW